MDLLSPVKAIFVFLLPFLDSVPVIRAGFGFILVFFLPGFVWTFIFFNRINIIERLTFSLALSIVFVTLSLLFADRVAGIKLTGLNSTLIIILITILPVVAYYLNRAIRKKRDSTG
ncbi:hypothetical protein ACFLTT_02825 [Chloroflexota bacterium]